MRQRGTAVEFFSLNVE